ncbi:MAG: hypothetical protein ACI91G_001231 [Gammaproteobacteria bacterium]|jgi:hypothetical protein
MRSTIDSREIKKSLERQAEELNFELLKLVRDDTEAGCAAFGMTKDLTAKIRNLDDGALVNISNGSMLFFSPTFSTPAMHEAKWQGPESEFKARLLVFAINKLVVDAVKGIGDGARMVIGAAYKEAENCDLCLGDLIAETNRPGRKIVICCEPNAFEKMVEAAAMHDSDLLELTRNVLETA